MHTLVVDQAAELRRLMNERESVSSAALKTQSLPAPSRRARVIAIASGKGGVGKTSLAVNLGLMLAARGRRTLLIDADIGTANVDVMLNVQGRFTLLDALAGRCRLADACISLDDGLRVILGASGLTTLADLGLPQRQTLVAMLARCEQSTDIVLLDCGAGVSRNVLAFAEAADDLWVVTTPEPTAMADAYALIKLASRGSVVPRLSVVVNCARSAREAKTVAERIAHVAMQFLEQPVRPIGHILRDDHVGLAVCRRTPFVLHYPASPAAACISTLAAALERGTFPAAARAGFFHRLAGLFC